MSPDKIRAAARKRMAETGEPYTAARREVIKNYQEAGAGPEPPRPPARGGSQSTTAAWTGSPCGWTHEWAGPGVEVDPAVLRVRMADFHLDIPRGSMRSATRSSLQTRGTIGVHARRGSWLVKGSHDGLVELVIDPPCYLPRQLSTVFRKMEVGSLIISLVDPDGFIAAVQRNGSHP